MLHLNHNLQQSILVEVMVKGRIRRIRIKDVLDVPKLHANFLSVSKILSSGCKVQFNMNECIVRAFDGEVIAITLREGNLYQRCACAPKHGEWYEPWKHALPYIFICL